MSREKYIQWILLESEGLLTKEQQDELNQWIKLSTENQAFTEKVRQGIYHSSKYKKDLDLDLTDIYTDFQNKSNIHSDPPSRVRKMVSPKYWGWAAGFLLLVFSIFLINELIKTPGKVLLTGPVYDHSLPDGSIIWLENDEYFSYLFEDNIRWSSLEGTAFFEVKSDPLRPFVTEIHQGKIKVLGTTYEILSQELSSLTIKVKSGQVQFEDIVLKDSVVISTGQAGIKVDTAGIRILPLDPGTPIASWRQPSFSFDSSPMDSVLTALKSYYPVTFLTPDPDFLNCRITFHIDLMPMDSILLSLETLLSLQFTQQSPGQYLVTGKGCN